MESLAHMLIWNLIHETENGEIKYVSRGYCYVHFKNQEDAKRALTDIKDPSIKGYNIEICKT